jgi:hypothetical protein
MANDDIDIMGSVMDTGKWRQEVYRLLKELREREAAGEIERKAHEAAMEKLGVTMELTKAELAEWHRELQAMHGKPKIDGWKFLRSVAAKIVGDIDLLSK